GDSHQGWGSGASGTADASSRLPSAGLCGPPDFASFRNASLAASQKVHWCSSEIWSTARRPVRTPRSRNASAAGAAPPRNPKTVSPPPPEYRASKPSRAATPSRSEEHTSELQSRENLVCRLLLE